MTTDTTLRDTEIRGGLELIASYHDYRDAQHAVDQLADEHFPVERLRVIGEGLTFVEDVQRRRGYGGAATEGAIAGALIAGFIGLLFGLLNWFDPLISGLLLGLYGVVIGAAFGVLFALLAHWMTNGERDFSSVQSLRAERYELLGDAAIAAEARELLAR
jgi:hypothetical protein